MVEFSADTHYRSLFLTDFFCVLALFSSIDPVQKCAAKKKLPTDRIRSDPEAGGSRFRTPKTPVSPQVAPKTGSAHKSQILLTTRLKSTSGTLTHLHSLEVAPSAQLYILCCKFYANIIIIIYGIVKNSEPKLVLSL